MPRLVRGKNWKHRRLEADSSREDFCGEQSEQRSDRVSAKWLDVIHVDIEGARFQSSQEREAVRLLEDEGNKEHEMQLARLTFRRLDFLCAGYRWKLMALFKLKRTNTVRNKSRQ